MRTTSALSFPPPRCLHRPLPALAVLAAALLGTPALAQRQWIAEQAFPSHYEIAVVPDGEARTFTGRVRAELETRQPLPSLTLNALGMTFSSATVDGGAAAVAFDATAQTATLTPAQPLPAGRHVVEIAYAGRIQEESYGLFRVTYQDERGPRGMLATQFEPADARRLAPMWDQPDRRAVFVVTVDVPPGEDAVSNMPAETTTPLESGGRRIRFAPTPSMPSYLLFLAVGDIERIHMDVDGVDVGVVARRGQAERGRVALGFAAESLRWFTEYFGIRYPLPKLDMVAVPGAGGFGAMENWGAILYFDQYLLLDADRSSEADRQGVFRIVAHEIAHQWFGNLVTMAWWDDLWLNEGFASWMAGKAAAALHPDWQSWLQVTTGRMPAAMERDAGAGTHPVVQRVDTIDEANLAFDGITYQKGLGVIRMVEAYVGEEAFRKGVRAYLGERLYGNARTEDLWRAVQAASGEPVLEIARSFTTQNGFPVVSARRTCVDGGSVVAVTQRRFAADEAARTAELWTIPVVARLLDGPPVRAVLPPATTGEVTLPGGCGPFVLNAGRTGFFRVLYDEASFAALAQRTAALDAADLLGLLQDYWAFGRAGAAPLTHYLELVRQLPADAEPYLALDTTAALRSLADYARGRPGEEAVRAFGRRTLRRFFDRVGWTPHPGEPANDAVLRAALVAALGDLGDEAVIAEARRRVAAAASDPAALPAAIRDAAIAAFAANATPAHYDELLARAKAERDFVEKRRLFVALAAARDPALANRTLELALGDTLPRQLRPPVILKVASVQPRLAWDFVVAHRAAVDALLDPLQRLEFPPEIAALNADPAVIASLEAYAASYPRGAQATVASAISEIRQRAEIASQRMPAVEVWITGE